VAWPPAIDSTDTGQASGEPTGQAIGQDAATLVTRLQDEVTYLRDQLAIRDQELQRVHVLLARALDRLPELPAGEPRESMPQDAKNGPLRGDRGQKASAPLEPTSDRPAPGWRSWWRRVITER
jgi:hypothetical protein